jgi:hypothetical protein
LPPAFFRFLLAKDTLALGYVLGAITRTWDFHPLENAHTEHTKISHQGKIPGGLTLKLQFTSP